MAPAASRRGPIESAAVLVLSLLLAAPALAQNAVGDGLFVSVPNPLTTDGYAKIKNRIDAARKQPDRRPGVIVFDFNPGEKDAAGTDFGTNYDLADYVAKLLDTTTVAYVH